MFINRFIFLITSGKVLQVGSIKMFNLSSLLLSIILIVGLLLTACGQQGTVPQESIVEEADPTLTPTSIDRGRTDDLVIGVPGESIGDISSAGAVNVLFGAPEGLTTNGNEFWNQDSRRVKGRAEIDDVFGETLAIGDFDGDRRDDLAIGVSQEDFSGIDEAGAVNVLYGFRGGLSSRDNQIWTENTKGIRGVAEEGDYFGEVLAVGDFNGDGKDDLAIGTPLEDIGNIYNSGAVHILYGSNIGLRARGNQLWHQGNIGLTTNESLDVFGSALTAGDFNGDGKDDLAIGIPLKQINDIKRAGMVVILQGSESGLTTVGSTLWHQDIADVSNEAEYLDVFGSALTSNDFNGDGKDDLAIGVPQEDLGSSLNTNGGMVHIFLGSDNGITARGNYGLYGSGNINYRFGEVLTSGNYDGDRFYDLAVGSPEQSVGDIPQAGRVGVFYGFVYGPSAPGQFFDQNTSGVQDVAELGDKFGTALASGDFNGDGKDDLAIGVPREGFGNGTIYSAGAVNVLYGSAEGITVAFNQFWYQGYAGAVLDDRERNDRFGFALAARK